MNKTTVSLSTLLACALAAGLLVSACSSTPEKPAATPVAEAPKPEAPKPEEAKPAAVAAETPKPAPQAEAQTAAPKPAAAVTLNATQLFEFDKAILRPSEQRKIDDEVIARLNSLASVQFINVNGHADRLGSQRYNQKLSERRAEAVKAYLVSRGVDAAKIETYGFGKTLQVKSCPDDKNRQALIECLAPNRRVVVEIKGMPAQ
ncbi:MAG: OmpA family protein [Betaproteobacteria bacterium]|nr:OmpA family protein [Betaproteobacteria bacterium]